MLAAACASRTEPGSPGGSGPGSTSSGGGSCPMSPQAMITLEIRAAGELVPPDTKVSVNWSAGEEPVFALDDPSSWMTLDVANITCDVDYDAPPPIDLEKLSCKLWTSGATEVGVQAKGFMPFHDTLVPEHSSECEGPVPTKFEVVLSRVGDAGT